MDVGTESGDREKLPSLGAGGSSSEARLAGVKPFSCANPHFRASYKLRIGQHY
jgi:hypothetical protein